jgi:glycosyltransferase involved in cell wall biosynthesis
VEPITVNYPQKWPWVIPSKTSKFQRELCPCISIIIPSYNQAQYIEETLRSILLQGYPSVEIIVIDGASSDNTTQILEAYNDLITYWISEPDKGQSDAINKGFRHASGDIITFCSSDDFYMPGTFDDVAKRWSDNADCGAIIGAFVNVDEMSNIISDPVHARLIESSPVDLSLGVSYRLHQVSTFYTQHALDRVGRYVRTDLDYTMDRELLFRVCREFEIELSKKVYGAFRKHTESKSTAIIMPFALEFAKLYLLFENDDIQENKKRRRMARFQKAKGYFKLSKHAGTVPARLKALLTALWLRPSYIKSIGYWMQWAEALGVDDLLRVMFGKKK